MLDLPIPNYLRDDVSVWLVYSGVRRKFFNDFIDTSSIFLDLPGFGANERTFEDITRLRQHVRMSDAIRDYYSGHRRDHPGRRFSNFSSLAGDGKTPEGRRFNAEVGNALRMYTEAKIGDIVLSPPVGHYDPFLIGKITGPWQPDDTAFSRHYVDDPVPKRRVAWIDEAVSRRDFPRRVARSLQNPHAISVVEQDLYLDIFVSCFDTFVWQDKSKLDVFGNTYSSHDPLETYEAAFVVKYFISAFAAFNAGKIEEFNQLSLQAAISQFFDQSLVLEFRQNFNSPGKFGLIMAAAVMGISVGAGITILTDNQPAVVNQAAVSQQVQASAGIAPEVKDTINNFVGSLSPQKLDKLNSDHGYQARAKIGMSLRRTQVSVAE